MMTEGERKIIDLLQQANKSIIQATKLMEFLTGEEIKHKGEDSTRLPDNSRPQG